MESFMNLEWTIVKNFAGIKNYNPEILLDSSTWLGQVIKNNTFEIEVTDFIRNYLKENKDSVCVDVGANIGYYTVLMSHLSKKVFAFEPTTKYFSILKQSCEKNNLNNCILTKKAVSNENNIFNLPIFEQSATFHDSTNSVPESVESVETILLDNFINEKINLIKIDCDGHDPFVLYGGKNVIEKYKPIIVIEVAWDCYEKAGIDLDLFYKHIIDIGYIMFDEINLKNPMTFEKYLSYKNREDISSFNAICFPKH
jgi:FkbM family methyltransferase